MSAPQLARKLGTVDAVMIGLGSMIGAGIFAVFAPAAAAAGAGLLIGLVIAAIVAFCNASSSAQLAAQYPTSGGTYVYGRERLGEWPGFFAGWSFVVGKTASCAAMALTFAQYAAPAGLQKPVAIVAVLALAAVNSFGVTRTAALARTIVVFVLIVLAVVVIAGFTADGPPAPGLSDGANGGASGGGAAAGPLDQLFDGVFDSGWYGILQSAGLLFFAFAGYARIATMGEEVKNPSRTIPRAILSALGIALVVYAVVAVTVLTVIGPTELATRAAPLVDVVTAGSFSWAAPLVRVGAAAAALGALLALIAGVGRTSLAMARNRDLPPWFSAVNARYQVPRRAEIAVALIVSVLIISVDLRAAIGFSSFGVLLYYLIANVAAVTQRSEHRRYPKVLQIIGAVGCLVLVATLPPEAIITGVIVLAVGIVYRLVRLRLLPARDR